MARKQGSGTPEAAIKFLEDLLLPGETLGEAFRKGADATGPSPSLALRQYVVRLAAAPEFQLA